MRGLRKWGGVTLVAWSSVVAGEAAAEAVLDGTTGSTGSFAGDFEIPAAVGRQAGTNLFHSFDVFNVQSGESATFTGPVGIDNVISRVTGGQSSLIDGPLTSTIPSADFFFLNPAGVVFGPDGSIDVPGSFHVSTGDELRFDDGSTFSASDPASSSFSMAAPERFGFLGTGAGVIALDRGRLEVQPGETLGLSAGGIGLSAGNTGAASGGTAGVVAAPGGRVLLTALAAPGEAPLDASGPTVPGSGPVLLTDQASISTDGDGGGVVRIRSGSLLIENLSSVLATNTGAGGPSAGIAVDAGAATVRGQSSLLTRTAAGGGAGAVALRTDELDVEGGSLVGSVSLAGGSAGAVEVTAGRVAVADGARINSDTVGAGDAGPVQVTADEITITSNGQIRSNTFGMGNAGPVTIAGAGLVIRDGLVDDGVQTGILSDSDAVANGNAGVITVQAGRIQVLAGGQIRALTFGAGNGGSIAVASGELTLDAQGVATPLTAISSSAAPGASGSAGTVEVVVDGPIQLLDGAQIRSQTFGPGSAGTVDVVADDILIRDANGDLSPTGILSDAGEGSSGAAGMVQVVARTIDLEAGGQIRSITFGQGPAGLVGVGADELRIAADGQTAIITGILSSAEAGSTGNAGGVAILADRIDILGGGQIRALTVGPGNAGGIVIETGELSISGASVTGTPTGILSRTEVSSSGNAGTIRLTAEGTVEITDGGQIDSSSSGFGKPGNIVLGAGELVLETGGIISSAALGPAPSPSDVAGGNVTVSVEGTIRMTGTPHQIAGISTDTAGLRNGGFLQIEASELQMTGGALISSSTLGRGKAGSVTILVDRLTMGPSTFVSSASPNLAAAQLRGGSGQIRITATESIELVGDLETGRVASVTTGTVTRGAAGPIRMEAPFILIGENAQVVSGTTRSGPAGKLTFVAERIELDSGLVTSRSVSADPTAGRAAGITITATDRLSLRGQSAISAETEAAEAGDIVVSAGELVELRASSITTSVAGGQGSGGNIMIDPQFVLLDDGRVVAQARQGAGGNITISAENFFTTADSIIDASSELGIDGTVDITAPDLDLTSELAVLSSAYVDVSGLLRESCAARAADQTSSFARAGRRGLAPDPAAPLSASYADERADVAPAAFHHWSLVDGGCDG